MQVGLRGACMYSKYACCIMKDVTCILYYCIEREDVCMYGVLDYLKCLPCLGSCCLPICLSVYLVVSRLALSCPVLDCVVCLVYLLFLALSCLVFGLVLSCIALSCLGLGLSCVLRYLVFFCLVLPCLALLVTDLVSSPESACLSALPCRVLGLALPCLVCYLDLSCLALSCLVWYLDLSCLALSCVALRGLALPCLVCRSRYIDPPMLTTV